ncbi:traf-interacting protein [Plakobranchus ocellatus]|uniref:Traf-interacting protein n=1 Tax=Plakobranchus ocellatus TaxID=259542 RepID=A0AAV4DA08_9GAST|nr:traf-interacting protein [Plakobranchus ocellatus]
MAKCFFGSKHFLVKLLPCHGLRAIFQFEVITEAIQQLESCGAKVVAVINDNNKQFAETESVPCLVFRKDQRCSKYNISKYRFFQRLCPFIDQSFACGKSSTLSRLFKFIGNGIQIGAVIDSSEAGLHQLNNLLEWTQRAKDMEAVETSRQKKLTCDIAQALYWTCHCLHDISVYLLNIDMPFQHSYVAPGFFQRDDIEQHFAHFRMAAGCKYFVHAAEIAQTCLQMKEPPSSTFLVILPPKRDYQREQMKCQILNILQITHKSWTAVGSNILQTSYVIL